MVADPFDYLFLEPLLVERVRAEVPGLALVGGVPDLASVADRQQLSPAVYLIYLGDDLATGHAAQGGQGRVQTVTQLWAAVLALYCADPSGEGSGARREAGPLLGRLLKALTGWAPRVDVAPLTRRQGPAEVAYADGYFYYPLVFQASFVFPRTRTWQP